MFVKMMAMLEIINDTDSLIQNIISGALQSYNSYPPSFPSLFGSLAVKQVVLPLLLQSSYSYNTELKQTTTSMATRTSTNNRFNEKNNGCACV